MKYTVPGNSRKFVPGNSEILHLLMEHGEPKEARICLEAGHMARQPGKSNEEVLDLIVDWVRQKLA